MALENLKLLPIRRKSDGQTKPFKKLPFAMAKETHIGSIPVGLSGLYHLKRKGSWIIRPTKIKISFGQEISAKHIADLSVPELRDLAQNEIAKLVERQ